MGALFDNVKLLLGACHLVVFRTALSKCGHVLDLDSVACVV